MSSKVPTGIDGLDDLLHGGLPAARAHLVCGGPGQGKTTLGAHFLAAAKAQGQAALFITFTERAEQVVADMSARGIDLSGVAILDLAATPEDLSLAASKFSVFESDAQVGPSVSERIVEILDRVRPTRVFLDALTQIRLFTTDAPAFHRQVSALLSLFHQRGCTVLASAESCEGALTTDLAFLCDGVLYLRSEHDRSIEVAKCRGTDFMAGPHSLVLDEGGIKVFPNLIPADHGRNFEHAILGTGVEGFDRLLGGGLERGTVSILTGPSGIGKTTIGAQIMAEAARRGERSVAYVFDESPSVLRRRCAGVSIPLEHFEGQGLIQLEPVVPMRYAPDELAARVRREVEAREAKVVMIDSVAGYRLALRGRDLVASLHALTRYLQNMGVTVLLTNEVENVTGDFVATGAGLSYMADNVIFLRYLEFRGELRRAVGVLKKRLSDFERTMRSFGISEHGFEIGQPLTELRGILTGVPDLNP